MSAQHVPGDVGAQMRWLTNRMASSWRDKIDTTLEIKPERTAAQAREELIAKLIE